MRTLDPTKKPIVKPLNLKGNVDLENISVHNCALKSSRLMSKRDPTTEVPVSSRYEKESENE
jgi:hypothetical protein